jgi:DNA-binding beta-propeller fold protein YncE
LPTRFCLALVSSLFLVSAGNAADSPAYKLAASTPLGAPDRWDYVVFDALGGRVYVAHGDSVAVVDAGSGARIGEIEGMPGGTHGIAISRATGLGFTDDGKAGEAIAFDLKTLRVAARIKADADADAIALDAASGHVFVVEGDPAAVQVIDPQTRRIVATIPGGGKLEYAVSDGRGHVFVNGEEKADIVRIDSRADTVDAHWPMPDCRSPHGLAIDTAGHRLFSGCANAVMVVMNSDTGAVIATLPIGKGNDAMAFDPNRKRVFSANGVDGTISVYQQATPDRYTALAPVVTAVSGRTMDVDPKSGRLFVAAADTDPSPTPGGRARPRPGTLRLMMLDPVR